MADKDLKGTGRVVYKETDKMPLLRTIACYKRLLSWTLEHLTKESQTHERALQARRLVSGVHVQSVILNDSKEIIE